MIDHNVSGIKKYIVGLIIKTSSDSALLEKEKVYVGKLNMILVQILKYEWPRNWPSFIGDIVGASKTNESLCQNNMIILKLLRSVIDNPSCNLSPPPPPHPPPLLYISLSLGKLTSPCVRII